jgi:DNA-binding response OmpR family regulator
MSQVSPRRKILIIEDEPSIRNILYVILAGLDFEGEIAHSGQQALRLISRGSFDGVILDLRCPDFPAQEVLSQIKELRPSLVGRVLVITSEVTDSKTLEWIEGQCLPQISGNRVMQDLWSRLRVLLSLAPSPNDAGIS